MTATAKPAMAMPSWLDLLGGLVERTSGFWRKVGDLETEQHEAALAAISIDRPIYIAGLARSGSTILLQILARHPEVATHQYRDFPLLFAPLHWDRLFGHRQTAAVLQERAHQDRIQVTPASPEAMEEVLWMAFFDDLHEADQNQVLDATTSAPRFEAFYRAHLNKMLLLRKGGRYLAKGNDNVTRLTYLQKLFPDARFLVPVREPVWHIASPLKQHRLFARAESQDPRILRRMRRVGHFEFGLDRRPINTGDAETARTIERLWAEGRDLEGYARRPGLDLPLHPRPARRPPGTGIGHPHRQIRGALRRSARRAGPDRRACRPDLSGARYGRDGRCHQRPRLLRAGVRRSRAGDDQRDHRARGRTPRLWQLRVLESVGASPPSLPDRRRRSKMTTPCP